MKTAQQFINQLREGNTTEAIKSINESLQEKTANMIEEQKVEILASYGFTVKEAKEEMEDDEVNDEEEKDEDKTEE